VLKNKKNIGGNRFSQAVTTTKNENQKQPKYKTKITRKTKALTKKSQRFSI
jgi:hypothetical protein